HRCRSVRKHEAVPERAVIPVLSDDAEHDMVNLAFEGRDLDVGGSGAGLVANCSVKPNAPSTILPETLLHCADDAGCDLLDRVQARGEPARVAVPGVRHVFAAAVRRIGTIEADPV